MLHEDRGRSEEHSSPNNKQKHQARDGIIAEGSPLQPCEWEPLVKGTCQDGYASPKSTETDDCLQDDECDAYYSMFHDGFPFVMYLRYTSELPLANGMFLFL